MCFRGQNAFHRLHFEHSKREEQWISIKYVLFLKEKHSEQEM
jgi:hypothetical protein